MEDVVGQYPAWPIIEVAILPTGNAKEERMNMFVKCITALFGEILYVDDTACIAPLEITDDKNDNYISEKAKLPSNFTKLGKWIMISGGSWVFNRKEKGSSNVYARFHLKSQVPTEEIINRVSFEFTCLSGTKIYKKQMQAMDTETPMMRLFVSNGTEHSSIVSDMKQLMELAYNDIKTKRMMPEEYKNSDMPAFSLKINAPRLPEKKKNDNKAYDYFREQRKKAFHFEVAKSDIPFFKFLCNHAHRMKLDTKYFGKFAKLMETLGNNAPINNCTRLWRCIQGHLNSHLSSTSITIHGIDNLDAAETLKNLANGGKIAHFSLRDMLYCIHMENGSPLFLQLSQRALGEVDAVISNTPEAKLMAKKMNMQIAAWCHFYWKSTNPGGERFYQKLSDRAFNQVMLHEISKCKWDKKTRTVTLPTSRSELSTVMEFENQDWVKNLAQADNSTPTQKYANPNVAFPFQDNFSVGTIHGTNTKPPSKDQGAEKAAVVEIIDDKYDVSILTTKTQDELLALLLQERQKSKSTIGRRAASGVNISASGLTADATPAGATGTAPIAAEGSQIPTSTGNEGRVDGGPVGE